MSNVSKVSNSYVHLYRQLTYSRNPKILDEMLAWNLDAHVMGIYCHDSVVNRL